MPTHEAPPRRASSLARAAFETLYRDHFSYVFHSLRRLGVPQSDLEDLAHDVFLTVHRAYDRYDPSRPLKPWIFGIAFRVVSDHRRLARHKREVPIDEREPADAAPLALELLAASEQRKLVHEALEELNLEQRAVFVMHELEGLSIPEIAEALDVGHNTLYSRLRLARERFERGVRRIASRSRIP